MSESFKHLISCTGCQRSGDRIPVGARIFSTRPDRPWGLPSPLYNGYRVSPGGQSGRGVALTTHLHLALRLKKEQSYTSSPLLGLHGLF